MPFTQDNDVIEAFTPDSSDDAFRQGDFGGGENLVDPHSLKPRAKDGTVGSISIPDLCHGNASRICCEAHIDVGARLR